MFLDHLATDIEHLDRLNHLLKHDQIRLGGMRDNEFTRILSWPGYRVYGHEIDERGKKLLWVRRKRGNANDLLGLWTEVARSHDVSEREVRTFRGGEFRTTVYIEIYRVWCRMRSKGRRCCNCRAKRRFEAL